MATSTISPFGIFLDIDLVLWNEDNSEMSDRDKKFSELSTTEDTLGTWQIRRMAETHFFSPIALENLHNLIQNIEAEGTPVQVIISSAWRKDCPPATLKQIFKIHRFAEYIIGKTPDRLPLATVKRLCPVENVHTECRASEIRFYLGEHPELTNYVILDDYDWHLTETFGKRFVQVDPYTLLTSDNIIAALRTYRFPVETTSARLL